MGRRVRTAVGFVVGAAVLVSFVVWVGAEDVFDALTEVDVIWTSVAVVPAAAGLVFRGLVWTRVLSVVEHGVSRVRIFTVYLASTFVKFVTPYGQVSALPIMTYLLVEYSRAGYDDGFAGILGIDVSNYPIPLISFGSLGLIYLFATGVPSEFAGLPLALALFFVVMVAPLLVLLLARGAVESAAVYGAKLSAGVLERVAGAIDNLGGGGGEEKEGVLNRLQAFLEPSSVRSHVEGFYGTVDAVLADREVVAVALVHAHVAWFLLALPLYFLLLAAGEPTSVFVVVLIVAVSRLGVFVPLPGGLGTVDVLLAGATAILTPLDAGGAAAVMLLYRLLTYWLPVVVGGFSLTYLMVSVDGFTGEPPGS